MIKAANFESIERLKINPRGAKDLTLKWQEFAKNHPEVASFETTEKFYTWAKKHPEIDLKMLREIVRGWEMENAYFLIREQHEDQQMQREGRVDPSVIPADLPHFPHLEAAYNQRPRIMEDDKDYQKLTEQLEKVWLEKNPGKDFTSREGIGYLYGSLEDAKDPTLRGDAEKIFREKYPKRAEGYDTENDKVYEKPNHDPRVLNLTKTARKHADALRQHLGAPEDIDIVVQKYYLEKEFIKKYRKKAEYYTKKGGEVISLKAKQEIEEERRKRKKTLQERVQDIYDWYGRGKTTLRVGRAVGGFAERAGLKIARTGGQIAIQSTRATIAGIRTSIQAAMLVGRAGAVLVSNPIGWIIIGVIAAILIIVFLIIMLAGGGGSQTLVPGRLYECSPSVNTGIPFDYATSPANCSSGPDVDCVIDLAGKTGLVVNGNTCGVNAAAYYSNLEGVGITAKCIDKCTDITLTNVCDRNASNNCTSPMSVCGGTEETFCIEYITGTPTPTLAPSGIPPTPSAPTPTPSPTPGPCGPVKIQKTVAVKTDQSPGSSFGVNTFENSCIPGLPQALRTGSGNPSSLNIPVNHAIDSSSCSSTTWKESNNYAVFSFSGLNLPQGTQILSATLSSPTSGIGCEAGFVRGRIGTVDSSQFLYNCLSTDPLGCPPSSIPNFPLSPTSIRFGTNMLFWDCGAGCGLTCSFDCGFCGKPNPTCTASPTSASGQANVISIIENVLASQALTSVSLRLEADKVDYNCSGLINIASGNFQVNSPSGPATLTINYCE